MPHEDQCRLLFDPTEAKRWLKYSVGSCDVGHQKISTMIHQSPNGAIYLTEGEGLQWDVEANVGPHFAKATSEAIYLLTPVKITIRDPAVRLRALKMLGAGLARALQSTSDTDADFLEQARQFVQDSARHAMQLWYFAAAVGGWVVLVAALAILAGKGPAVGDFRFPAMFGAAER